MGGAGLFHDRHLSSILFFFPARSRSQDNCINGTRYQGNQIATSPTSRWTTRRLTPVYVRVARLVSLRSDSMSRGVEK